MDADKPCEHSMIFDETDVERIKDVFPNELGDIVFEYLKPGLTMNFGLDENGRCVLCNGGATALSILWMARTPPTTGMSFAACLFNTGDILP